MRIELIALTGIESTREVSPVQLTRSPYVCMRLVLSFLIAALLLLSGTGTAWAEVTGAQIKAAYVLKFVEFVKWPDEVIASRKITLCVVGANVLGGALTVYDGVNDGNFKIRVLQVSEWDLADSNCQVVFIGVSEQRRFVAQIKSLEVRPILTISDIDDFAERGGAIGLRQRDGKIVFEVNLASLARAGLKLPAQLLNLAYYVFH
jgi:YfiR/HmsC-like